VTNYVGQEAEQDPERSEGSCEASCCKLNIVIVRS